MLRLFTQVRHDQSPEKQLSGVETSLDAARKSTCAIHFSLLRVALSSALALLLLTQSGAAQGFFPLKDVRPGMHGVGRTIFHGEQIEEFQVEILGVLDNLGPKQSIILARLSGGPLAQTGVMQGMSGSPVYIDGKLLGAIALGFPFSKEPIAGIQPIESMLARANSFTGAGHATALQSHTSPQPIASPFGNLAEILTPVSFSGFTPATLPAVAAKFRRLGFEPQEGVSAGAPPSQNYSGTVKPGSMISVSLLSGDLNMNADGTVTYVDGKRIYAFGHRFLDAGSVELPFARSDVIAVVPSLTSSFKISAPRTWIGTIVSDRSTALVGEIGRSAHTVPMSMSVHSDISGSHEYHFQVVNDRMLTPLITQTALFSVVDATERTLGAGTLRLEGRVQFEENLPDMIVHDTFVSDSALPQQVSADAVVALGFVLAGDFRNVRLKKMSFQLDASEKKRQLRVAQAWASAHEAHPGDSVAITTLLQGDDGVELTKTINYKIPVGAPLGALNFTVSDANTLNLPEFAGLSQSALQSPVQLIQAINAFRDSDALYVRAWRPEPSFTVAGPLPGGELGDPPPSVALILADPSSSVTSNAALTLTRGSQVAEFRVPADGYVVSGAKTVQVDVKE